MEQKEEQKKTKNYKKVAEKLETLTQYTKTKDIGTALGMKTFTVKSSIRLAKLMLAKKGVIISNLPHHGYKVGNYYEFLNEVDKACKRAQAQLGSMAKIINFLEDSGQFDSEYDFQKLRQLVLNNLNSIRIIYSRNYIEELVPDFVNEEAMRET